MSKTAIRYVTLLEMNDLTKKQKDFKGKCGCVSFEKVFLFNPGAGMTNARAYKVCRKCGKYFDLEIDEKTRGEIQNIISDRTAYPAGVTRIINLI